jgi:excinuclease ABC subunit A
MPLSRERGYTKNRFSYNAKSGRCQQCEGKGATLIEMHFLSDIWIECPLCQGSRFNDSTLEVLFQGYSIAELLQLPCKQALNIFKNQRKIYQRLNAMCDVGLGYLRLGQPSNQLSGGESQRIKLATELAKGSRGKTVLFLLDEPTTGLHPHDIQPLISTIHKLVEFGHSVVVIEHNQDVIKCADYIIDLGPEGGIHGGQITTQGTPEQIVNESLKSRSHTASFLAAYLE